MASLYLIYDECDNDSVRVRDGAVYVAKHFKDPPARKTIPDTVKILSETLVDVLARNG